MAVWSLLMTMGRPSRCFQYFFKPCTTPRSSSRVSATESQIVKNVEGKPPGLPRDWLMAL